MVRGGYMKVRGGCEEVTGRAQVAILGTTYSGHFEDVEALDAAIGDPGLSPAFPPLA